MIVRNQFHPGPQPAKLDPVVFEPKIMRRYGSLIAEIAAYQARTGLADSPLGRAAGCNEHFVRRVRMGLPVKEGGLAKLRAFMRGAHAS